MDSGLPALWTTLSNSLRHLGHSLGDIRAVVLTHAHFDQPGLVRRLHAEQKVPVWVHPQDAYIARHPYRYRHERSRFVFFLTHPGGLPVLTRMARAGALQVKESKDLEFIPGGGTPPVPGAPETIFSPGHISGHCGLFLRNLNVLFSGDAPVTLDPYPGKRGPRVVAGAATANSAQNLKSLAQLAATGADLVLPGHGEPWSCGTAEAVAIARRNGPA